MLSAPIQKRLSVEKNLTLKKAMEIAQSMEVATKQFSELRTLSGSVLGTRTYSLQPLERPVTDVETKDIHKRNVILKHKNVTIVRRKDILLWYAGHPQDNQAGKIQPSLEQPKLQDNMLIL